MLNRQFVIKEFLQNKLAGVIDWQSHVTVVRDSAGQAIASGDHAAVEIFTKTNKYRMDVWSSTVQPPLGRVELVHDRETIGGNISDNTWTAIAAHIREAEPNQEQIAEAARAVAAASVPGFPASRDPARVMPADRRPFVGMGVLFRNTGGTWRNGMEPMPAMVLAVHDTGALDLAAFSGGGETIFPTRVPFHSDGDFYSWKFIDDLEMAKLRAEVAELRDLLDGLTTKPEERKKRAAS